MLDNMKAAGPGAEEESQISPKPVLEGASQYEYVTILNPLPVDFWGKVASDRPVNAPLEIGRDTSGGAVTMTEQDVVRNYGLNLRNKDHVGRASAVNRVLIPAGKTLNIIGSEAQVIVRQLVNEIMQREGKKLMLADAHARHEVEQRVVISKRSINDYMNGTGPATVSDQLHNAVDRINEDQRSTDEPEFPDLGGIAEPTPTNLTSNPDASEPADRVLVSGKRQVRRRTVRKAG